MITSITNDNTPESDMKYQSILSYLQTALVVLTLSILSACSANYCGDLVFNEALNTCVCPEGTEPDYDVDACVGDDGLIIPWGDVNILPQDGGQPDSTLVTDAGAGTPDADQPINDAGRAPDTGMDAGVDAPTVDSGNDAGPPPANALARFPWNGFTTGSLHARDTEPLVNHPLRPKFMWETTADADHYQIQLTRECDISEFRTCPFARTDLDETTSDTTFWPSESLAVARTRPMGSRYFWRVRACSPSDVCSDWTEIRYVDVGRDSHDYNGDGYADAVIGAERQSLPESREGIVYIYSGASDGVETAPTVLHNPTHQANGNFGGSVAAVGDVNADGYYDLLVGARFQDTPELNEGAAYLYFGSATGIGSTPSIRFDNPLNQPRGNFGIKCAGPGDFDGDGYADLLVGARTQGAVYLYRGATEGPTEEPMVFSNPRGGTVGQFGTFITSGADYDGDGFPDFVISTPYRNEVFVFAGGSSFDTTPSTTIRAVDTPLIFGILGQPGDLTGNGFADLVVGHLNDFEEPDADGSVQVFLGSRSGIAGSPATTVLNPGGPQYFGVTPTIADTNGDGVGELMVGAEDRDGAAFIFNWAEDRLNLARTLSNPGASPEGGFGTVAMADYNGDGYADAIIGARRQDNHGATFIFFGSPTGIPASPGVIIPNPEAQRGSFGVSVQ